MYRHVTMNIHAERGEAVSIKALPTHDLYGDGSVFTRTISLNGLEVTLFATTRDELAVIEEAK